MNRSYDAVVIGAGIVGASIGFELAKAGRRVVVVDRLPAAGYGSTSSSSAIIRVFYSTVEGALFALEGLHIWRSWAGHVGDSDDRGLARYVETGCLAIKTEANGGLARIIGVMDRVGIPYQEWDAARLAEERPYFETARYAPVRRLGDPRFGERDERPVTGAVFFPQGGYVTDPQLAAHNVQRVAEAAGAKFMFNRRVVEVRRGGGRVSGVTLESGDRLDAPVIVNAAGPHSATVNRMAGVEEGMNVRTRPLRQEVAYVPMPEAVKAAGGHLMLADDDVGCYCRGDVGDKILIGSMEPACDPMDWVDDPDSLDRSHSEQWTAQVHRMAQRIPDLPIPNTAAGVVDLYDVSDDWIPIYDRSDLPGFYMAVGTSGNQFKAAPVAGELMAALIAYCENRNDHDSVPLRFRLRRVGRTIDAGFFSRRRNPNRLSSGTVIG